MFYFVTRVMYFKDAFVKKFLENLDSIEKILNVLSNIIPI